MATIPDVSLGSHGGCEAWTNRVLDLVVGVLGIGIALLVLARVQRRTALALSGLSAALSVVGEVLGWRAYRRRTSAMRAPTP